MSAKEPPKSEKISTSVWYSLTTNRLLVTLGSLKEEINCDVCVIGGGFTGISAALELSQKGFSVVLLEAKSIASSASGKNGGHITRGFPHSPDYLSHKFGHDMAKTMCDLTLEGLAMIIERIGKHGIKCDLKFGSMVAAMNDSHIAGLKKDLKEWAKIGHTDFKYLDKDETQAHVKGKDYIGGLFDPKGAHFHPLNYALGIADAAQKTGCKIYDETPVISIEHGNPVRVVTRQGAVKAKFVVIGGNANFKGTESVGRKVIDVTAHMIATEPLGEKVARDILPKDIAVIDANFIMNYYRLSHDNRLLFGGNCNYSGIDYPGQAAMLRQRMLKVFPQLSDVRIDNCWHGPLDITANRLPHFGRLAPNVFFAHGFSGHGLILTNLAGRLLAEAVSGTAERFDVFSKIGHAPFFGGDLLKRPLFVLGMTWFRMKDSLGIN